MLEDAIERRESFEAAIKRALKSWLDENKADLVAALAARFSIPAHERASADIRETGIDWEMDEQA